MHSALTCLFSSIASRSIRSGESPSGSLMLCSIHIYVRVAVHSSASTPFPRARPEFDRRAISHGWWFQFQAWTAPQSLPPSEESACARSLLLLSWEPTERLPCGFQLLVVGWASVFLAVNVRQQPDGLVL